jgi:UDP-N-acetylglucosamine--N-acetylmuramyl-(pentapeptide) pyrophosphoryl-undecaprenol N-acetylglucosamine transferase
VTQPEWALGYRFDIVLRGRGQTPFEDAEMDGERAADELIALLTSPRRLAAMSRAARASGHADADQRLARLVLDLVRGHGGEVRDPATEVIRIDPRAWRER